MQNMDNFMLIPSEGNESNMMSLDRSNKAEGSRVLRPKKVPSSLIRESFSNRLRRKENKSVHITRNFTRKCLARKENKKRISFENQQKKVVGYDETRSEERKKNIGRNQNINRVKEGRVSRGSTPLGRPKRARRSIFSSDKSSMLRNTFHLGEGLWEEILEIRKKQESSNRRYPLRVRKLNVRYGYT